MVSTLTVLRKLLAWIINGLKWYIEIDKTGIDSLLVGLALIVLIAVANKEEVNQQ